MYWTRPVGADLRRFGLSGRRGEGGWSKSGLSDEVEEAGGDSEGSDEGEEDGVSVAKLLVLAHFSLQRRV